MKQYKNMSALLQLQIRNKVAKTFRSTVIQPSSIRPSNVRCQIRILQFNSILHRCQRTYATSTSNYEGRNGGGSKIFEPLDSFARRHIGPNDDDIVEMCKVIGVKNLEEFIQRTIPISIRTQKPTSLGPGIPEKDMLNRMKLIATQNKIFRSYIGMGYTGTVVPSVILRNIMENPGWYTQYTPYQAEISQGRLESLINWQTMVSDLTALPISNASLLDEGTAAGEAMLMSYSASNRKKSIFFVDQATHPQTIACVKTRAEGFGINVVVGDYTNFDFNTNGKDLMGVLIQYPTTDGRILDYSTLADKVHECGGLVTVATDLLALTILKPPGEFGADIAFGNSQRFGVPLGYGGPHAAFFAVKDELKRKMPGRLIGTSKDSRGKPAYRLALQTREQHIKREKATSNICTAQALLANMAAMYAVYHGPKGLRDIALRIHGLTCVFVEGVRRLGHNVKTGHFFDTVNIELKYDSEELIMAAQESGINVRQIDARTVGVTLDETVTKDDVYDLLKVFATASIHERYRIGPIKHDSTVLPSLDDIANSLSITSVDSMKLQIPNSLHRTSPFLQHKVFNSYHSETEMLRYIHHLQSKDLSLAEAMIPLGSCTMKLNATTEMVPVTWPEFASMHPFAPGEQARGYMIMLQELEYALGECTGFDAISLQPNSGAQGEYTGLRVIKAWFESKADRNRNICLIPVSAHGTNPASAALAGMDVVTVKCLSNGNLDLEDLKIKASKFKDRLAAIMITYPSTFGVFEDTVKEACEVVHQFGGQVYMDGANLNAQIGLTKPAEIGADVCHLNLHKTFCIPHGGGGPGMGPIGVKAHLAPFLPGHPVVKTGGELGIGPVSAAPWGSASILPISWAYLKMMGDEGLVKATQIALLNANYMKERLKSSYKILYTNDKGMCAHEFIIDCRPFQEGGIEGIDIAKRLHDYGFHSPTMSFPVPNTLMIEPTESESKRELDRFCDAMISIRKEIQDILDGKQPKDNNVLVNAPHPLEMIISDNWDKPYSRESAAYPLPSLRKKKFWPSVSRVDDAYGDRNLICSCPPLEEY